MANNDQLADLYLDNAVPDDDAGNLIGGIENLLRYILRRDDGADEAAAEPQPQPQQQQRDPGLAAALNQFLGFGDLAGRVAREVAEGADDDDVSDDDADDGGAGADTMGRCSTGGLYDWATGDPGRRQGNLTRKLDRKL